MFTLRTRRFVAWCSASFDIIDSKTMNAYETIDEFVNGEVDNYPNTFDFLRLLHAIAAVENDNLFLDEESSYVRAAEDHVFTKVVRLDAITFFDAFEHDRGRTPELYAALTYWRDDIVTLYGETTPFVVERPEVFRSVVRGCGGVLEFVALSRMLDEDDPHVDGDAACEDALRMCCEYMICCVARGRPEWRDTPLLKYVYSKFVDNSTKRFNVFDDFYVRFVRMNVPDCTFAHFIGFCLDRLDCYTCESCTNNERCTVLNSDGTQCTARPLDVIDCEGEANTDFFTTDRMQNNFRTYGDKMNASDEMLSGLKTSRRFVCSKSKNSTHFEHMCKKHNGMLYKRGGNITIRCVSDDVGVMTMSYTDAHDVQCDDVKTRDGSLLGDFIKCSTPTLKSCKIVTLSGGDAEATRLLRVPKNVWLSEKKNFLVEII